MAQTKKNLLRLGLSLGSALAVFILLHSTRSYSEDCTSFLSYGASTIESTQGATGCAVGQVAIRRTDSNNKILKRCAALEGCNSACGACPSVTPARSGTPSICTSPTSAGYPEYHCGCKC